MVKKRYVLFVAFLYGGVHASQDAHTGHTFIYSHGFTSCQAKARSYSRSRIIPPHCKLFNYSDAYLSFEPTHGYGFALDFWDSCIGQDGDVNRLADEVDKYTEPVILAGESRGAATIINCLGSARMQHHKVAAAVLDSPFDTVNSVIEHRLEKLWLLGWFGLTTKKFERVVPYICWNYNPQGIQPITSIETIKQKDIPMLLICSAQDVVTPPKCTAKLYQRARELGHTKVHLLALSQGQHGWIMQGPCADLYRNVVHAFYDTYHIDHGIETDPDAATYGHDILDDLCQPTVEQLAQDGIIFLK